MARHINLTGKAVSYLAGGAICTIKETLEVGDTIDLIVLPKNAIINDLRAIVKHPTNSSVGLDITINEIPVLTATDFDTEGEIINGADVSSFEDILTSAYWLVSATVITEDCNDGIITVLADYTEPFVTGTQHLQRT